MSCPIDDRWACPASHEVHVHALRTLQRRLNLCISMPPPHPRAAANSRAAEIALASGPPMQRVTLCYGDFRHGHVYTIIIVYKGARARACELKQQIYNLSTTGRCRKVRTQRGLAEGETCSIQPRPAYIGSRESSADTAVADPLDA